MSPQVRRTPARKRAPAAKRRAAKASEAPPSGTPALLAELLAARGASGHETAPVAIWRSAAEQFARVETDPIGTPRALLAPRARARARSRSGSSQERAAKRLLLMGHIDEIGLIVTHIDDEGYLWVREVGGWDPQILVGQRVIIDTADGPLPGVVGRKPIHLLREEERKKVPELSDLHVDIGARDGKHAAELVRVGDVAVIDAAPLELQDGRLASRALDNRLGSYVALEALRQVAEAGGSAWEMGAVAVVQEETTFGGSRTSAFALAPDAAIVIDVTHATDAPGIEVKPSGRHPLGSGPVLGRGSTLHEGVFELLYETARAEGIPFTIEASGRATGTDADAVHASRAGVPTGLVMVPLRYMHSPVETVDLRDVQATARLLAAAALALPPEHAFVR
ncbi:MAG TPA: M20/M25/M40 family metallo-hydrolase [Solirubrobacteraceae bacterium]|nr:M20/M25/M40 family metallo-hydrolase [Solirubrobacteraceae bacterium]